MTLSDVPNEDKKDELDLIDLINELQNKLAASGHSLDISLPQIVVVGCQSAGKSSVLESFVGKEFLPRGPKVVTRRPIVVQLIPATEEYGIFLHKEEKKFTDFKEIKEEIVRVTQKECGQQGFSKKPISLKIYSPKVLKLTVIDLPGIISVAVEGQLEESVTIVREMVLDYISQDKCIILAVTPAGQDIANSAALGVAKIADPNRERTIGVLTKIDLMDKGTDVRDVLENIQLPLRRGWVGVLNRSHKDITDGKDMQYILEKEKQFFRNSEQYKHIAYRLGTPYLQKLLQKTLRAHIKECLPSVRSELSQKLYRLKKTLTEFEKNLGSGPHSREYYMNRLIQKFCNDMNVNLMGHSELVPSDTVTAGALINYKMYTEIQRYINSQLIIPKEEEIAKRIASINGIRPSISVPALAVDSVCRKMIEHFKIPVEVSVDCISNVLRSAAKDSATSILNAYPSLRNEVLYQIELWIEKEAENTKDRLKSHVDAEMFYINFGHPDFDSAVCDPLAPPAGPVNVWYNVDETENKLGDEERTMTRNLMKSDPMKRQIKYVIAVAIKYMEIIQKEMSDITLKYIVFFLVKKVLDNINSDLIPTVVNSANIKSLVEDCEDEFIRKDEMEKTCECLNEALQAIKDF